MADQPQQSSNTSSVTTSDKKREKGIRCFLAIPIADSLRPFLSQHLENISRYQWAKEVRWLDHKGWHITLHFLGSLSHEQIDMLNESLNAGLASVEVFDITVLQPQAFPGITRPRAIACPIKKSNRLLELVQQLESIINDIGIKTDARTYRGHITLARIQERNRDKIKGKDLLTHSPDSETMPVKSVVLYQSVLEQDGAKYSPLYQYDLRLREE